MRHAVDLGDGFALDDHHRLLAVVPVNPDGRAGVEGGYAIDEARGAAGPSDEGRRACATAPVVGRALGGTQDGGLARITHGTVLQSAALTGAGAFAGPIQTVLMLVNSLMP